MMATADVSTTGSFTYIWILENFSKATYLDIQSPSFVVKSIGDTRWYLTIDGDEDLICCLKTEDFLKNIRIEYELSFVDADGSPLISKQCSESDFLTVKDFLKRWSKFILNNTLTIQCRIRKTENEIPTVGLCYARTKLNTYQENFTWTVEKFSALKTSYEDDFRELALDEKRICPLKPLTQKGPFIALILYMNKDYESEGVCVDILIEKGRDFSFFFEISVLDINGKVNSSEIARYLSYYSWMNFTIWHLISKAELIAFQNLFLPNDSLHLKCSTEINTGIISSEIEYCTQNVFPVLKRTFSNYCDNSENEEDSLQFEEYFMNEVHKSASHISVENINVLDSCSELCSLKLSMRHLYNEAILSDASLQIGTKLFPVHQNILSSRSPKFKNIFSDHIMGNIIEINNMNESTLHLLLQYLYSDTVNLQLENALSLYKAAACYQLLELKEKCSDFLRSNLFSDNLWEIGALAVKYEDEKLDEAVQEYIDTVGIEL